MSNKIIISICTCIGLLFIGGNTYSQSVGISGTGISPDASAMLDVSAPDKGLLIPRVALTSLAVAGPITAPATSLLVYNNATAGTSPNNVTPGYYYWDGTKWVRVDNQPDHDWHKTDLTTDLGTATTIGDNIYTNGKVGIGTVNPSCNLHVYGADSKMRIGPNYPSGGDRDFIELQAHGTDTKIISPNETFHLENSTGNIILNAAGNVGVNETGAAPDASAMLDISATDKGLLVPKIILTATNVAAPVTTPATGLLVYNTNIAGTPPNNVIEGFYYWDAAKWVPFQVGTAWREFTTDIPATSVDQRIYHNNQVVIGFERDGAFDGLTSETDFDASNANRVKLYVAGDIEVGAIPDVDPLGLQRSLLWNGWRDTWNGDKISAKIQGTYVQAPGCGDSRTLDIEFYIDPGTRTCAQEVDEPANDQMVMHLNHNGNVGIGTSNPDDKLHLSNGSSDAALIIGEDGPTRSVFQMIHTPSTNTSQISTVDVGTNGFNDLEIHGRDITIATGTSTGGFTSTIAMFIDDATQYIGIGTSTPNYPLHVTTTASGAVGANRSHFAGGSTVLGTTAGDPVWNFSIVAAGNFATGDAFVAYSDERIKDIIGTSDASNDLATLLNIEITDYTFKDKVEKGSHTMKKVIAQQVEEVYPQVVKRSTEVIPNIYSLAELKEGYIALETDLKQGEKVQLIFEDGTKSLVEVLAADAKGFKVDIKQVNGKVFVYGRQVDDFRSVDYEGISMLNVSATQELYRIIENSTNLISEQKEQIIQLEEKIEELESKLAGIDSVKAIVEDLQNQINELKKD